MAAEEIRKNNLIPFEEEEIKAYLDCAIRFWRKKKEEANKKFDIIGVVDSAEENCDVLIAGCYVDAFQSVRMSLFGELLPLEDQNV